MVRKVSSVKLKVRIQIPMVVSRMRICSTSFLASNAAEVTNITSIFNMAATSSPKERIFSKTAT